VVDAKQKISTVLGRIDGVTEISEPQSRGDGWAVSLTSTKDLRADVSRAVVQAGLDLLKLDYARSELENTFLRLVDTGAKAEA
jgi:hypothetical protein